MSEFKVGDKAKVLTDVTNCAYLGRGKRLPIGTIVEIKKVIANPKFSVRVDAVEANPTKEGGWYYSDNELELIPEYKTLAVLWEEKGNKPFTAIHRHKDDILRVVGIDQGRAIYFSPASGECNDYHNGWSSEVDDWQLYQEPEEKKNESLPPLPPLEERTHNEVAAYNVEWRRLKEKESKTLEEKKTETRCEHEKAYLCLDGETYKCPNCEAEFEEKWLWYFFKDAGHWELQDRPLAEDEAKEICRLLNYKYKKAKFSRELFEVGK